LNIQPLVAPHAPSASAQEPQFCSQVLVCCQNLPDFDKGTNDKDVHLNSSFTLEHRGKHRHAMLSKSIWHITATAPVWGHKLWPQIPILITCKLKHEIFRKAIKVALNE
jgi:hypothetical protein